MIERVAKTGDQIVISTPALSELIVQTPRDRINDLLTILRSSAWFKIQDFDSTAAIELGIRTADAIAKGDKREGLNPTTPWTKVKFDRQIVAIAMASGATELISDDPDVKNIAERWGYKVSSIGDLPLPSELVPPPPLAHLEEVEDGGDEQGTSPDSDVVEDVNRK